MGIIVAVAGILVFTTIVFDDTPEFLILDSPRTQIENINGILYYVSEPFPLNSSVEKIIFHDVEFGSPYRHSYPRLTYSDVIFSDGTEETLSVLFDYTIFSEHVKPQTGLIETHDGIRFLVSVDLKELSTLKQIKSGIPFDEIQCRESLVLVTKHDGSPACVKPEPEPTTVTEPELEPDTGEFRYGQQECHYTDANGEQNFCVVEGWTKPASELDCEEICKPPPTKGMENEN